MKRTQFVTITLPRGLAELLEQEIQMGFLDEGNSRQRRKRLGDALTKISDALGVGHNHVHANGGDLVADLALMVQRLLDHDDGQGDDPIFIPAIRHKAEALVARVWGDKAPPRPPRTRNTRPSSPRVPGGLA